MSEPRWLDYKRGRQVGRKPGIRAILPIGLAFVALALTGCQLPLMNNDQGITDAVWVTNNTHVPLRFTIITPDEIHSISDRFRLAVPFPCLPAAS